jgi:hypothetical protein
MNKLAELDQLCKVISDSEIRLKSVLTNIETIDKEIAVLTPRKNELEQNLEFLKQKDTIPIAQEFKKSKLELSKIKARLCLISSDRAKAAQACKDIEVIIEKFKKDHRKLIITSDDNVLEGNFGAKRGKK